MQNAMQSEIDELRSAFTEANAQMRHWAKECEVAQAAAAKMQAELATARAQERERCEDACSTVKNKCMAIHNGTTSTDPVHDRFLHQANGADECCSEIRALTDEQEAQS